MTIATGMVGVMALASYASAETTLKVSTCLARNHDQIVTYFNHFHDPVNKARNGITLHYLGGPEITPESKQAAAVQRGLIDMIVCPSAYYAGMVPEALVTSISNQGHRELRANGAYDLMNIAWAKGAGMRIIAWPFWQGTMFHVYLTKEPKIGRKTGLDLSGQKIRSTPLYNAFLKAMGATPVVIAPGEVYTSLQRGVVNGLPWPEGAVTNYGWQQYIKYRIEPGFWRSSTMVTMSLDKYNAMPKKERDLLDAAGLKLEDESGPAQRKIVEIDNKKMFAAGVKVIKLEGETARNYLATVSDSTWDDAKKRKFTVPYEKLRALLYKRDGGS
jgi:TRAP-type C4-dicarboxylate transport system substrate-binding protein